MERDHLRQNSGDMHRDLEEKEGSIESFGESQAKSARGSRATEKVEGVMGDSRPDQVDAEGAHFVDASEDPNQTISRHSSNLSEPERRGAEELAAVRHDDSTVNASPQEPLLEEGSELGPRQEGGEQS